MSLPGSLRIMTSKWNRALITGASSGIGREIARQLAADGSDLVLVARDQERLETLAMELAEQHDVEVEVLRADLADRTELTVVADRLQSDERPIDLLVNNAGFGHGGLFHELDLAGQTGMVDVNITALHRLTHAAAKTMVPRQRGGILNISSVAGHMVTPQSATYGASKAFVSSFSEAIHEELAPLGVTVTAICPGLTRTEFHERADFDDSSYPDVLWQQAEDVASEALDALDSGRARVVTGNVNKAFNGVLNVIPRSALRKLINLGNR